MRHDHLYAKHQKRISPPFRKSKRGFDDWVRNLRSIDQHPYDISEIQLFQDEINQKKKTAFQSADFKQQSINVTEPQHIEDEERL